MGPTRKRDLTAAVVGVAALAYLLVHVLYRNFPPITVWTGLSLLLVALGEAAWGVSVRARIRDGEVGVGGGRLHPLVVARSVVIAKASAWVGAVVLGEYKGLEEGQTCRCTGRVLEVDRKTMTALVEGLNMKAKHGKPSTANPQGGITHKEGPIHISNLMLIDAKTGEPGRVGRTVSKDGAIERVVKTKKSAKK